MNFTIFERELQLTEPDIEAVFQSRTPTIIQVEDNGLPGVQLRAPLYLAIRSDGETLSASFTLDEATRLRNILNEAIVWAEGALS